MQIEEERGERFGVFEFSRRAHTQRFVKRNTNDVDLLFGYPGIQDPFPIQATTVMQVR